MFHVDLEFAFGLDVDLAVRYKSSVRTQVNYVVSKSDGKVGTLRKLFKKKTTKQIKKKKGSDNL